jgi:hypothetical protein
MAIHLPKLKPAEHLYARGSADVSVNGLKSQQRGNYPKDKAREILRSKYNLTDGQIDALLTRLRFFTKEWHHGSTTGNDGRQYPTREEYYPTRLEKFKPPSGQEAYGKMLNEFGITKQAGLGDNLGGFSPSTLLGIRRLKQLISRATIPMTRSGIERRVGGFVLNKTLGDANPLKKTRKKKETEEEVQAAQNGKEEYVRDLTTMELLSKLID